MALTGANEREPHGESRNGTWSPRLHFPRIRSFAIFSNCLLLLLWLSFVFESQRPTMDYYLCMQVLLKSPICEQRPFPRCPNRKIAPQLLFAEPVTMSGAAAELPAVSEGCFSGRCLPLTAPPGPACAAAQLGLRAPGTPPRLLRPPGQACWPPSRSLGLPLAGWPSFPSSRLSPLFLFCIHRGMKTESTNGLVW